MDIVRVDRNQSSLKRKIHFCIFHFTACSCFFFCGNLHMPCSDWNQIVYADIIHWFHYQNDASLFSCTVNTCANRFFKREIINILMHLTWCCIFCISAIYNFSSVKQFLLLSLILSNHVSSWDEYKCGWAVILGVWCIKMMDVFDANAIKTLSALLINTSPEVGSVPFSNN